MKRIILIIQIITISIIITPAQISDEDKRDITRLAFQHEDGTLKIIEIDLKEKKLLLFNTDNILERSTDLKI